MSQNDSVATSAVMTASDDLPIRSDRPVHSGKVRSVYFLTSDDSRRLIDERAYPVPSHSLLAIMVISDRLSAFDCLWQSESYAGVPGKGAALNAIAAHWFAEFSATGLPSHHLLETPHPLVWVVRQARPVKIEAIARRYLTGSLWRAYERGDREVGGITLDKNMPRYARLPDLLFTPSTKGIIRGIPGIPESDDAPVSAALVRHHAARFGLRDGCDLDQCEHALRAGFACIEAALAKQGELLVDTKFEFGFAPGSEGEEELIYMDEIGTPDSSRIWRRDDWEAGRPREHSKEQFRESLLSWVPEPELLLDASRMPARKKFAELHPVPDRFFETLAATYRQQAERITGTRTQLEDRPREAMLDLLQDQLRLLQ